MMRRTVSRVKGVKGSPPATGEQVATPSGYPLLPRHFPGMDGLVAVHTLRVVLQHLAQRVEPVQSPLLERTDRGHLPLRAVAAALAPRLDHPEVAVTDLLRDAPALESF